MDFLKENRNIVILIALLVIGYLLFQSDTFKEIFINLRLQWEILSNVTKLIIIFAVIGISYYLWTKE